MSGFRVKYLGLGSVWSLWKALSLIEPKMSQFYYRNCSLEAFLEDPSKIEVWKLLEYFWLLLDTYGCSWKLLGQFWLLLGTPGHFWLLLGTPGTSGSFWSTSGYFLKWIRQWGEERQRASASLQPNG